MGMEVRASRPGPGMRPDVRGGDVDVVEDTPLVAAGQGQLRPSPEDSGPAKATGSLPSVRLPLVIVQAAIGG